MTRLVALIGAAFALVLAAAVWASPDRSAEGTILIVVDATPATATNVVNTNHTVTATITDFGTPQEGFTVFFDITSGPNAGDNASGVTDVNGEATFTYTGDGGVGQDSIDACVFSVPGPNRVFGGTPIACDTVTKDWIDPTPTPSPEPSPSPALAAGTANPSPSPTAAAPVSLPGTGGEAGAPNFTWIAALMFVVIGGAWVAGVALLRRI